MLIKDPTTGKIVIKPVRETLRYVDNGKVKIGSAYVCKPMRMSAEEIVLQDWLLGGPPVLSRKWY